MSKGGFGGITSRFDLTKPVIAAVNGFALGGGCEIALACDIIIAADHARLGLPEPRVGLMAGAGGVHRLPRHIPLKIAMGMILTGKHLLAAEAHRWGLVNEVRAVDGSDRDGGAMGRGDHGMLAGFDPGEQGSRDERAWDGAPGGVRA